jgi:hypothetical protein
MNLELLRTRFFYRPAGTQSETVHQGVVNGRFYNRIRFLGQVKAFFIRSIEPVALATPRKLIKTDWKNLFFMHKAL